MSVESMAMTATSARDDERNLALLGASQMARFGGEDAEGAENHRRYSSELGASSSGGPKLRSKLGFGELTGERLLYIWFHSPPPFKCGAVAHSHHDRRHPRRVATRRWRSQMGGG
jgi:hypothetical protein